MGELSLPIVSSADMQYASWSTYIAAVLLRMIQVSQLATSQNL